jgi:hypothetical protein
MMKKACANTTLLFLLAAVLDTQFLHSQEARSGFDLRATLTGQAVASNLLTEAPRSGSAMIAGSRSIIYPTLKINDNWFVTCALQLTTRPYYYKELSKSGYGAKGIVLQSTVNYSHVSHKGSFLMRVGEMSTAFGAFMLHYDDNDNALVDLPSGYGYYYAPVSIAGVAGAQIDATRGKWDARVQFANSSPANPRSLFAHDQYGNWAGGAGYTIRQGFRMGISGYRGPYLDRHYAYFFPGEANPNTLPATGLGLDVNWAHGHISAQGEVQKFVMTYKAIPDFHESTGYGEVKQVLSPRWYVAFRGGYSTSNAAGKSQTFETAAGFRPDRLQLIKISYEYGHLSRGAQQNDNVLAIQLVTSLQKSVGRE